MSKYLHKEIEGAKTKATLPCWDAKEANINLVTGKAKIRIDGFITAQACADDAGRVEKEYIELDAAQFSTFAALWDEIETYLIETEEIDGKVNKFFEAVATELPEPTEE